MIHQRQPITSRLKTSCRRHVGHSRQITDRHIRSRMPATATDHILSSSQWWYGRKWWVDISIL